MKALFQILLLAAAVLGRAPARAGVLEDAVATFTNAYERWDTEGFAAAEELAARAVRAEPRLPARYWKAVIQFHQVLAVLGRGELTAAERKEADGRIGDALDGLGAAVTLDPRNAECWALLGTLTGIRIGLHPRTALWRGPRVLQVNRRAIDHGADNARARYLLGTCAYFGPAILGGKKEALEHFRASERLYEAELGTAAAPLDPRWGYASCLTFIVRCCQDLGRNGEAEAYMKKALAVNPKARAMLGALHSAGTATEGLGQDVNRRLPGGGGPKRE